jgi:uncharacterized protein
MNQKRLSNSLSGVVEACVNSVGINLNTASPSLLSYVAGISSAVAKNILTYREQNGKFSSRSQLLKAFEQCAGFLRVAESKNFLDATAVHPESYAAAEALLARLGYEKKKADFSGIQERVHQIGLSALAKEIGVGEPTLQDIIRELQKPGRDPRDDLPPPLLRTDVLDIGDLAPGMELTGTVRNVIDFGAFVDIGVHQDGLVHISRMADRFIKHPSEAVKVGDIVNVEVLSVDVGKKRISLSMKRAANGGANNAE